MDIFTHTICGVFTGYIYEEPILGGFCAILPDIVLGLRRRSEPNFLYNMTHSLTFIITLSLLNTKTPAISVFSHILLDFFTHGSKWGPPLFFPFKYRFNYGNEWEWFSGSWWNGLYLAIIWSLLCVVQK